MDKESRYEYHKKQLDRKKLVELAIEAAGLDDFGSDEFLEPLDKLLDCVARDVDFHPDGLDGFKQNIIRCLVNRLRIENDIKKYPEILDEDVDDPIIVIGLGRSGTTKLHKMLSAPDSVQKTLFWRLWNPGRFPDAKPGEQDPRIAAAGSSILLSADNPVMDAAHHIEEQEVEEEWFLYLLTFEDWGWVQQLYSPSYFDWVMSRPSNNVYHYVKKVLKYLQWQDGGKQGRPWVLKTVGYIADMDALTACYPKATFVHPHRDPKDTIPSYAKFLSGVWPIIANPVDNALLGREVQRTWGTAMNRYLESRQRLNLDGKILDVSYDQVRTDPMAIMKTVYERSNRHLSSDAEQKMAEWHENNEQGKYGKHIYSLEEFGLSKQSIQDYFSDYINRFIAS